MKHRLIVGLALALALSAGWTQEAPPQRELTAAERQARAQAEARRIRADLQQSVVPRDAEEDRRIKAERQARKQAEQARREYVDALPPDARAVAELCHEADAVMGMVVSALRVQRLPDEGPGFIAKHRRYLPAARAETALDLSRLARNLRKEAEHHGHPC